MICVWWDWQGIIHYEILKRNQTVNAQLYVQQLKRQNEEIQQKRRDRGNMNLTVYQDILTNEIDLIDKCLIFPHRCFFFHHYNAPCYRLASTVSFLEDHNICLLDWPANFHFIFSTVRDITLSTTYIDLNFFININRFADM